MSKISLKSILKKTFKKSKATKSKKKAKTKKIVKLKKVKKKINKLPKKLIKTKKIPLKKSIKSEVKTTEQKSDGLRITKNNEAKPEIKKVKKQETEKKIYYAIACTNANDGSCCISDVIEESGFSRSTVYKTIKKFEENQIIKMYQSSSDKREFNLVLAH